MAPDPTFGFVGGPCCLTLRFVSAFWIMILNVLHIVKFANLYKTHQTKFDIMERCTDKIHFYNVDLQNAVRKRDCRHPCTINLSVSLP
jgi:hypothetical protein